MFAAKFSPYTCENAIREMKTFSILTIALLTLTL